jgi:hypothetical protein
MPTQTGRVTLTDQLRRERLLDIEARLRRFRIPVFVALGISLIASGPWVGWLWIGPLIPAIGVPVVLYKVMLRSPRPEVWAAVAWSTSPIIIALCVVMTGGPESPGISWFVLTAVTLGARFERRGVIAGLGYTFVLLLASTVAVDPHEAAKAPQLLIMPVGLGSRCPSSRTPWSSPTAISGSRRSSIRSRGCSTVRRSSSASAS